MTRIGYAEDLTAPTDTNGDILLGDVTDGENFDVLGVFSSPRAAACLIVRPWPTGGNAGKEWKLRCFKRNTDGTVDPMTFTQVHVTWFALTNDPGQ